MLNVTPPACEGSYPGNRRPYGPLRERLDGSPVYPAVYGDFFRQSTGSGV